MKNNENMGKDIMRVENLYFKYRRGKDYAIRGASFCVKEGMLYGMVGKNSAGKSTLLKLLCGLESRHGGEITLNNHTDIIYIKKNVGIISEEQRLFSTLTIFENAVMYEKVYESFKIEEFLEYINLYNINRNDRINVLSESDRIKVKIALVLARHVKVMLLDEPAGVLDVAAREALMRLLKSITIDKNITVIMATHLTDDIENCADYFIFVNQDGTVETDDRESLNDKYMLLKGKKADIEALPREAIFSLEERESYAIAMTACFSIIRGKIENTDIVTEFPSISKIMYYRDKQPKNTGVCENNERILQKRTKSKTNTYRITEQIYDCLYSLYGRRWGLSAFFMLGLLCVLILNLDEGTARNLFKAICKTICLGCSSAHLMNSVIAPKLDEGEMYEELRYLPVRAKDIIKYNIKKLTEMTAAIFVLYICVSGMKLSALKEILIAVAVCVIMNIIILIERIRKVL